MAAIGGIFNADGRRADSGALVRMSRAMSRRGLGGRSALILGGCALIWGDGQGDSALSEQSDVILLCDGEIYVGGGARAEFFGESGARLCAEAFRKYGVDSHAHLRGEYAIAAFDRKKGELALLRDREGGRPLYYTCLRDGVAFASEIKGLIAFLGEAQVSRERVRLQVLSRYGEYGGEDIYTYINDVRAGSGVVISGRGTDRFGFGQRTAWEEYGGELKGVIEGDLVCPDEEGLKRMLCEILYAFDYPQFDHLMPTFLRDCERARETEGYIADGALCLDLGYAAERRDRLSAMIGYRPRCVPPDRHRIKEKELKRMEQILRSILSGIDRAKLEYIFGAGITEEIFKIENIARRIRCLGMLIQSDMWYDGYRISLD